MKKTKPSGNWAVAAVHLHGGYHPIEAVFSSRQKAKEYIKERPGVMQMFWCSPKYEIGDPYLVPANLQSTFQLRQQ